MEITFFHWAYGEDSSIKRSFAPLINKLKETNNVYEYSVPYLGSNPFNVIKNIFYVYKHRNKNGINHVTGDIHYCILGLIGVKSVLTIHDDYAFTQAKKGYLGKLYKWLFWLYLPIKFANEVLCISPETKKSIDKLVKNSKTRILTQHCLNSNYKESVSEESNKPILLQVGTLPQKNLETTLKAIKGLYVQIHIIRKMSDEQIKIANSLNIDFVNLYDLSDEEIINEYKKAKVVLFPSLKEGFGMPIIEAQSIGRPVITSNLEPMNWVAGNNYPLLINPFSCEELRDSLIKLLNDEKFYKYSVSIGLENAKRFNINIVYTNFLSLYTKLYNQ